MLAGGQKNAYHWFLVPVNKKLLDTVGMNYTPASSKPQLRVVKDNFSQGTHITGIVRCRIT